MNGLNPSEPKEITEYTGIPCANCDFNGALWLIYGIEDAIALIHGPIGCGAYNKVATFITDGIRRMSPTTCLLEKEVIFGGEDKLEKSILRTDKIYGPKLIAVITTSASSVIDEDIVGVVERTKNKVKAKLIAVESGGFSGIHTGGKNKALLALIDLMRKGKKIEKSVNIIGPSPYAFNWRSDLWEIKRLLNGLGLTINSVLAANTTLSEISKAANAELNILMYDDVGLPCAVEMEKRFDTPYIGDKLLPPIGYDATIEWINSIASFFDLQKKAEELIEKENRTVMKNFLDLLLLHTYPVFRSIDRSIGISCESTYSIGLTNMLISDLEIDPAFVVLKTGDKNSMKKMNRVLGEKMIEVVQTYNLDKIRELLEMYHPRLILGSTFDARMAKEVSPPEAHFPPITIRTSHPSIYHLRFYDKTPFMGFNGMVVLTEEICNALHTRIWG